MRNGPDADASGPFHVSIEDLGGQPFAAANRRLTSLQLTMFQKAAM